MDSSLCCPWCELKFSDRQKCYRHKKFKHSEEYKASLLKHSSPDELTFKRCLCCNCWTLNNSRSIENHEESALHKSVEKCNKKKRKSVQLLGQSSLPISATKVKKEKLPEAVSHPPPAIEPELDRTLLLLVSLFPKTSANHVSN
jgi:hypothetical protein